MLNSNFFAMNGLIRFKKSSDLLYSRVSGKSSSKRCWSLGDDNYSQSNYWILGQCLQRHGIQLARELSLAVSEGLVQCYCNARWIRWWRKRRNKVWHIVKPSTEAKHQHHCWKTCLHWCTVLSLSGKYHCHFLLANLLQWTWMTQQATYHPRYNTEVLSILIYYPNTTLEHYIHLHTFLQHVSAVLFGHHQGETQALTNWDTHTWRFNIMQ